MSFNRYKPLRLIELFGGIGSQAKALKNLGVEFQHLYVCEWDKYAIQSYNAGNSIVVNVLMAIFKELLVPKKTRSEWLDELLGGV